MGMLAKSKILSVLFVGVILAGYLFSAASGMLVCTGDGAAPDCCRNSSTAHPSRAAEAPILARADCDCCIAVDAPPANAGASSHKGSLDVAPGTTCFRTAVLSSSRSDSRGTSGNGADARLSSLRTVILLV